jgi:hypothetical protein
LNLSTLALEDVLLLEGGVRKQVKFKKVSRTVDRKKEELRARKHTIQRQTNKKFVVLVTAWGTVCLRMN